MATTSTTQRGNSGYRGPTTPVKRGNIWCSYCQLETERTTEHCEDCGVCIEDMDHHCVFFSKCIGGGNIYFFWGTIGGVLFNFLNIALMIGVTAAMKGGVDSPSHS